MASLAGVMRTPRQPGAESSGAGVVLVRAAGLSERQQASQPAQCVPELRPVRPATLAGRPGPVVPERRAIGARSAAEVIANGLVRRAAEHATGELGAERVLPVLPELRELLPGGGLRRGSTVAVGARFDRAGRPVWSAGATSLLLALIAAASRAGSWCAVVGVPALGVAAADELGVALDRLALVPYPGPDWATVVAALLDGVDVVVAATPGPVAATVTGRLAARARHRGGVLVPYGRWDGADVTLDAVRGVWHGLGQGRGRLRCRQLTITAHGRGAAAVPKRVDVWLPGGSGRPGDGDRAGRTLARAG